MANNFPPEYLTFWNEINSERKDQIEPSVVAQYLLKTSLNSKVLHSIWELSDSNSKGYLNQQDFYKALKLVSFAQQNLPLNTPLSTPTKLPVFNNQTISEDETIKYKIMFESLNPSNGFLNRKL